MSGGINSAVCSWVSGLIKVPVKTFYDLRRGNEIFTLLTLLDNGFFQNWENDIFTDFGHCEESQILLFSKENWFIITKALETFVEKTDMEEIQINSEINDLAEGQDDEMLDFFFGVISIFLDKRKNIWLKGLSRIEDEGEVAILSKLQENIEKTPDQEIEQEDLDQVPELDQPAQNFNEYKSFNRKDTIDINSPKKATLVAGNSPNSSAILIKIDKLESQVVQLSGVKNSLRDEMDAKDKEIEKLLKIIQDTNNDMEKIKEMKTSYAKEAVEREKEKVKLIQHKLSLSEGQIELLELEIKNLKDGRAKAEKKVTDLRHFEAKFKDLKNKLIFDEDLRAKLSKVKREIRQKDIQMDGMKQNLELYKKQLDKLNQKWSEDRNEKYELQKENESLKTEVKQKIRENSDLESIIERLQRNSDPSMKFSANDLDAPMRSHPFRGTSLELDEGDPYEHIEYLEKTIEELKSEKEKGWIDNSMFETMRKTEEELRNKNNKLEASAKQVSEENKNLMEMISKLEKDVSGLKKNKKKEIEKKAILQKLEDEKKNNKVVSKVLYGLVEDLISENSLMKAKKKSKLEKRLDFMNTMSSIEF